MRVRDLPSELFLGLCRDLLDCPSAAIVLHLAEKIPEADTDTTRTHQTVVQIREVDHLSRRAHFLSLGAVTPAAFKLSLSRLQRSSHVSPSLLSCSDILRPILARNSPGVCIPSVRACIHQTLSSRVSRAALPSTKGLSTKNGSAPRFSGICGSATGEDETAEGAVVAAGACAAGVVTMLLLLLVLVLAAAADRAATALPPRGIRAHVHNVEVFIVSCLRRSARDTCTR